jgi:hypothetical protein
MEHGLLAGYAAPEVTDYGNLVEITAAVHLLVGAADISDLSFSGYVAPGGSGELGGVTETSATGAGDSSPGSGGDAGATAGGSQGGSSGSSGGGGQLPFTGFAAGAAAAIGSALAAGGAALRRASGGRRRS